MGRIFEPAALRPRQVRLSSPTVRPQRLTYSEINEVHVLTRLALLIGLGLAAVPFLGCEKPEEIEHYRQLKPDAVLKTYFQEPAPRETEPAPQDRMFAAIIPHGGKLWFFKLVGPTEAVRNQSDSFAAFVDSVHFNSDGPQWTLPKDWRQLPASGSGPGERFATIEIPAREKKPLEASVTSLPKHEEEDDEDAVLVNVNRWRGQMGRESLIDKRQIKTTVRERKTADGTTAYVLGLLGKFQAGGMKPPFAGGSDTQMPPGHPAIRSANPSGASSPSADAGISGDLKYEVPTGWRRGQTDDMRKAAFTVEEGSRRVSITVVVTEGASASDISANVNRWRNQLGLPPAAKEEVAASVKPIQVGDAAGSFVEIVGPKEPAPQTAVYSAMAPRDGKVWSVTMRGDTELAAREKERFQAFVKSIQFAAGGK